MPEYPLAELEHYFGSDKLVKILLDKDWKIKQEVVPTDIDYTSYARFVR